MARKSVTPAKAGALLPFVHEVERKKEKRDPRLRGYDRC